MGKILHLKEKYFPGGKGFFLWTRKFGPDFSGVGLSHMKNAVGECPGQSNEGGAWVEHTGSRT